MENVFGNISPTTADGESSDDSFVFQDVLDLQNDEHRVDGNYNQSWGTYAIESNPWDDKKCPYVNILNKALLKLNPIEKKGILTIRMIAAASSYLSKSPITKEYVLCKCNLSRYGLKSINIMKYYHHFEYIDLSHNNLSSVSALKNAAMLMYLDVSHNMLDLLLEFRPPLNLTFVNYSHNCITTIDDLEQYWSIIKLDLSHNDISNIKGIDKLQYLQDLDLSYNNISVVNNIGNLKNLIRLNLSHNKIVKMDCSFKNLRQLKYVDLGYNKINKLGMFRYYTLKITKISIEQNKISNLLQLTYLQNLSNLLELDIRGNAIISHASFWDVALNTLRCIKVLNGSIVDLNQKLYVENSFNSTVNITLSKKKNMLRLINNLQTSRMISNCLLPANLPTAPLIILVGPMACKKNETVIKFAKYKKNVKHFVNHTTRPKLPNEVEGEQYFFVTQEEFTAQLKAGEFLTVLEIFGHTFGLNIKEIEKKNAYSSSYVFVTHADLISALLIRDHGYMPTILLTIPKSEEVHRKWLTEHYSRVHVHDYYSCLYEKQTCKLLPTIDSSLQKIVHSIVNELSQQASTEVEKKEDAIIEFSGNKENRFHDSVEQSSVLMEALDISNISIEEAQRNVEKSCLRKKEYSRERESILSACGNRPTVTFHETEGTSKIGNGNDSVSLLMLGYNTDETFIVNSLREVEGSVKIAEEAQISEDTQEEHQTKQMKRRQLKEDSKVKTATAQHYQNNFKYDTIASEIFVDSVIKSRNFYIDYHNDNYGIFSDVIFTDEPEEVIMTKLKNIADNITQPKATNDVCSYLSLEDSVRLINEKKQELRKYIASTQISSVSHKYLDKYIE